MLEFKCPRCNATLREEDCTIWDLPVEPEWDRIPRGAIRMECWACTWSVEWDAKFIALAEAVLP